MNPAPLTSRIDHLVVVADTLAQGVAWCEATLGITPGPGGRHPLMGTHNRLLPIGAPAWPEAYLEIIAVDPEADGPPADGRARWFGMDDAGVQAAVRQAPRLMHLVAQTDDIVAASSALARLGEDVGHPVAATRATPHGPLHWQISLRGDGQPQHGGALPALIEWRGRHPSATMPSLGIRLDALRLWSPRPAALAAAVAAIGLQGVVVAADRAGGMALEAQLSTPLGPVRLQGGAPGFAPSSCP